MKLVLLTGATGFLGKHIHKSLSSNNYNVSTISRFRGNYTLCLETDEPDFSEKFDLIIHAAGKAHFRPVSKLEEDEFYRINVLGTQNLLNGLKKIGPPACFVFISSVAVYGSDCGIGIDESSPLLALDPYGLSKLEAEKIVLKWCKEQNVKCTILRLPLVIGNNPPGNLNAMINGIRKGYFFNISGGSATKSMVLATDVSKFILKAAEVGGIFNLTDGYHPSFKELSNMICRQLGRKKVYNLPLIFARILAFIGDIVGQKFPIDSEKLIKITSTLTFDDSKARKAFGWDPTPVLKGFKIQ